MRRVIVVAVAALAGCPAPGPSRTTELRDPAVSDRDDGRGRLARELETEVRASYQRPGLDAAAAAAIIDPSVGLVAIGVGPSDLVIGPVTTGRWPVSSVGTRPTTVVSRALEVHVAVDESLGWAYDEATLELPVCGRVAAIPLRVFQIYARDADRWTLVAEHLAYAQSMGRWLDAAVRADGSKLPDAVEQQPDAVAARDVIAMAISPDGDRAATWDGAADALAVWPDPLQVLRGGATQLGPSLAASLEATAVSVDGIRLALGPTRQTAFATTTLLARTVRADGGGERAVDVRLRASFVLEHVGDAGPWRVRAAMVSVPITAGALVGRTVGMSATMSQDGVANVSCPQ